MERRELKREQIWGRIHLIPLLQAELDRDSYRRHCATVARETDLLRDVDDNRLVPGQRLYHTNRIMEPRYTMAEKKSSWFPEISLFPQGLFEIGDTEP